MLHIDVVDFTKVLCLQNLPPALILLTQFLILEEFLSHTSLGDTYLFRVLSVPSLHLSKDKTVRARRYRERNLELYSIKDLEI